MTSKLKVCKYLIIMYLHALLRDFVSLCTTLFFLGSELRKWLFLEDLQACLFPCE